MSRFLSAGVSMRMSKGFLIAGLAFVPLALPGQTLTEAQVERFISGLKGPLDAFQKSREAQPALETAVQAGLADLPLREATLKQLLRLMDAGPLAQSARLRAAAAPRLAELAALPREEGAQAAALRLLAYPVDPPAGPDPQGAYWAACGEAYKALLAHPGLDALLKRDSREAHAVFGCLDGFKSAMAKRLGLYPALIPALSKPMSTTVALAARKAFDLANDAKDGADPQVREQIRALVSARSQEAFSFLQRRGAASSQAYQAMATLQQTRELLEGAWAKGQLMDRPAPALPLLWCSDGKAKAVADFKGKVVVLDFWATWCGPCIRSMPNLRKLQERYQGYPVVILGLTSPQGTHFDRKANRQIDTQDNPTKEIGLMAGFMQDMAVTWTIAFSKAEVFNKDFGITGIPHLALLDAQGRVRFNNLRPYNPPAEEARKIDALLKEAGLPFPAQPMAEGNWSE